MTDKNESNTSNSAPESGISDGSAPYAGWPKTGEAEPTPRKRRRRKREEEATAPLSINSLMDIVTILLVYLLKSYATSPIDVKDPAIELPISTSTERVEDATVVMITGPEKKAPNPADPANAIIVSNVPTIAVDGSAVAQIDPETYRVPSELKDPDSGGYVISALRDKLKDARDMQEATAEISEKGGFTGKVVILADRRTPYRVLTEVLVTCGEAGFGEFRFAIVKDEG